MEDEVQLKFLKATATDGVYVWPQKDDVSWQCNNDILKRLPKPTLLPGRGLKHQFNVADFKSQKIYVFK